MKLDVSRLPAAIRNASINGVEHGPATLSITDRTPYAVTRAIVMVDVRRLSDRQDAELHSWMAVNRILPVRPQEHLVAPTGARFFLHVDDAERFVAQLDAMQIARRP